MSGPHIDARDYQSVARAMRAAGNRELRQKYTRALREVGRPFGRQVAEAGAARLPRRGGLASRVAAARVGVQAGTLRVTVSLRSTDGYDLAALRRGALRHPVFGRAAWVRQRVDGDGFQEGFDAGAERVREAMHKAAEAVLQDLREAAR